MWVGGVCRLMDDLSRYGRWGERWRNGETDEEESMEHCNGDRGSFICLLHPTSQSLWEIGPLTSDSLHRLCLIFVIFHCLPQPSWFPTLLSFFEFGATFLFFHTPPPYFSTVSCSPPRCACMFSFPYRRFNCFQLHLMPQLRLSTDFSLDT